jgi:hypothetical protein
MPTHRPENNTANLRTSQSEAAEKLHVSGRSVNTAKSKRTIETKTAIGGTFNTKFTGERQRVRVKRWLSQYIANLDD